ncbi:hypothetical protein AN935_00005 [Bacillus inaquosorum]|nr:hypothetical protein AN935_00005 [Bacillus inaquosorum]
MGGGNRIGLTLFRRFHRFIWTVRSFTDNGSQSFYSRMGKHVFAHPTVEGLASVIREGTDSPYEAMKPAEKREAYPVSSAQKRIYVLQQLEDGGTAYNMPAVLELEGKLDPERLDRAFKELIKRHESLRTSFEQDESGEPVQRIHDEVVVGGFPL